MCKHRKHKKRRKHRKHHHRGDSNAVDGKAEGIHGVDDQYGTESDLQMDDEVDSVDSLETLHHTSSAKESLRALAARNISAKNIPADMSKVQWATDEDMVSSITEDSSGSSYVSTLPFHVEP